MFRVGATNGFNVPPASVAVAKPFIEYYFQTYDTNRNNLARCASSLAVQV